MRHIFLLLTLLLAGCGLFDSDKPDGPLAPIVQDGTPYILSVLEATPDTVHHHPEVYVGRVYNALSFDYDPYLDPPTIEPLKRIFQPMLSSQVTNMCAMMRLRPEADTDAEVWVVGPLGEAGETRVAFTHEAVGVYGDVSRRLVLREGSRYRLEVGLSDGRRYEAETEIPERGEWNLPSRLEIPTKLYRESDTGIMSESGEQTLPFYTIPAGAVAVFESWNGELEFDRMLFGMHPGENFRFQSRGNWLRGTLVGQHAITSDDPYGFGPYAKDRDIRSVWVVDANHIVVRYDSLYEYRTLQFLNKDLFMWYNNVHFIVTTPTRDSLGYRSDEHYAASKARDTTYLPRLSNLHRVNESGQRQPRVPGDAVGVFAAYSARYYKMRLVPLREGYDACRLWPSTPCKTGS